MNPAIYEGAAGVGQLGRALSSYESVSGLGALSDYIAMSGLGLAVHGSGGVYIDPNCPPASSQDGPAGVPVLSKLSGPALTMCTATGDPIADLCNASRDPLYCYHAKKLGKPYANRGSADAVNAWRAWNPAGAPQGAGAPGTAGASGGGDTMLYVGGAAVLVALVGGIYVWKKRHKKA